MREIRPTLFVSDLHLSAERPQMSDAFERLLAGPALRAEALYILGDLFDYWAGDDDLANPFNARIVAKLSAATALGTTVFLMHGNRDFLIDEDFAQITGVQLLEDPTLIKIGGERTVLAHGDTLCTDDADYQRFRSEVHDPKWRRRFLATSLAERHARIEDMRAKSEAEKRKKTMAVMDVNADAVIALFRSCRASRLIHGHTHQPATHELTIDGRRCERRVLADWHERATCLLWDGKELRTAEIAEL